MDRITFLQSVGRCAPVDCWPWGGRQHPNGYGVFWDNSIRQPVYVHRFAWELHNGPIPRGLTVDHVWPKCTMRHCCNPSHMELVTLKENGRRGNLARWGTIGDDGTCRHGHVGERARTKKGVPYCRACNRERTRARRAKP